MINEFEAIKPIPTRINLKRSYPQSVRFIVMRSWWAILAYLVALVGYFYSLTSEGPVGPSGQPVEVVADQAFEFLLFATGILLAIKFFYEVLYYIMFCYELELEHLVIIKGVFVRSRAAFPIAKINDISLRRNFIEFIFGLHTLNVLTASPVSEYGEIEGLSKRSAVDLQSHLLALVETTLPDVKENSANEVIESYSTDVEEIDRTIHKEQYEALSRKSEGTGDNAIQNRVKASNAQASSARNLQHRQTT